ncbi:hypothetical protein AGOR_G00051150 [Albula goreensis]|uniref:Uncharacterized protein n=1 Tax=Albula goreensis TaxID=1534307 RepID=A0A8T3DYV0_9TELE|nr:hypothetical protein AGOR_G00051150 [Albula goreensis]
MLESPKKKKKKKDRDREIGTIPQMSIVSPLLFENTIEDSVPSNDVALEKRKQKKKKHKRDLSEAMEVLPEASEAEATEGKIGTLSKSCGTENLVCKEELHDCTLDIGSGLQELDSMYIEELKEFIPSVAQKSTDELHKLVKYDLPRFREFKKEGVCIKHGKYSKEELRRLEENVADFLVLTGIDSSAKLFFPSRFPEERAHIVKMKNIHKFHLRMSAGICRPWHDIYHKGRRYFDPNNRGRFTDDEIHSLQKLHTLYGNNWMKISELTGRSSHSLEKRFSQLSQNKGPWTQTEQEDLERAIKDHLLRLAEPGSQGPMVNWDQLYNNLPWAEVAKKVGTRSWDQCRVKWMALLKKKMTSGTQVGRGEKSLETNIKLIKALYAMEIEDVADVNWEDLTQNIGDVTPYYLQTKFYRLKATWVPRWQNKSFGDIIDFLYENILPQLEQKLHSNHDRSAEEIENIGTSQESFLVFHV